MKPTLHLPQVLHTLQQERANCIAALRSQTDAEAALAYKQQLDAAIACLQWCERYQVSGNSPVQVLPFPRNAFGEYVLLEADESGDYLPEPVRDSHQHAIAPDAGDLIVRLSHVLNLQNNAEKPTSGL